MPEETLPKRSILKVISGALFVSSVVFAVAYIIYAQKYHVKLEFAEESSELSEHQQENQPKQQQQQELARENPSHPAGANPEKIDSYYSLGKDTKLHNQDDHITKDSRGFDKTIPLKIPVKQLPPDEEYEYSIARLIKSPYHRLELMLKPKSTKEEIRMKVACVRPPETNKFYVEMVASAVGEFFGERSYPLAHGMVIKMSRLAPSKRVQSISSVSKCIWNMNGSSVIGGAVTPFLPGLKRYGGCDHVLADKYGVALQWLLDILTGNTDRSCKGNAF